MDFELKESQEPINISGTLLHPIINDEVYIKEGVISVVNRNFKLLNISEKNKYANLMGEANIEQENSFKLQTEIVNNKVVNVTPIINLTALTIIDTNLTSNITLNEQKYRHLLLQVKGPVTQLNKLTIDHFNSNTKVFNNNLTYIQTYYLNRNNILGEQDDFMKIIVPELDSTNKESGSLIGSIGETQLNYFINKELLRPIEREIAEKVGLEDLQINYNFGQELINPEENINNTIGINAIKNITNKLMIQVKSDIDIASKREQTKFSDYISEIELTYYLLQNLSFNYSNSKDNIYEEQFKSKVSLRFTHEF